MAIYSGCIDHVMVISDSTMVIASIDITGILLPPQGFGPGGINRTPRI